MKITATYTSLSLMNDVISYYVMYLFIYIYKDHFHIVQRFTHVILMYNLAGPFHLT